MLFELINNMKKQLKNICKNLEHSKCTDQNCSCLCHTNAGKNTPQFIEILQFNKANKFCSSKSIAFFNEPVGLPDYSLAYEINEEEFENADSFHKAYTSNAKSAMQLKE